MARLKTATITITADSELINRLRHGGEKRDAIARDVIASIELALFTEKERAERDAALWSDANANG